MSKLKRTLIVGIGLLAYAGTPIAGAANFLDEPVPDITTFKGSEISSLCQKLNRPCGIELKRCRDFQGKGELIRMRTVTLRKVLDQIVQEYPEYKWVVRDEIVNLEPIKRIGPDLLSRNIGNLSIHGISGFDAFQQVVRSAGIRSAGSGGFGSGPPAQALVNLELKHATVRDAVNKIAKLDGHVVWSFCSDNPEKSLGALGIIGWGISPMNTGRAK